MGFRDRFKKKFGAGENIEDVSSDGKSCEESKNFRYLDNLIHSGEKEIVLDSDIVLADTEEEEYLEGIKLDIDDLVIDGAGHAIDACGKVRIFIGMAQNIKIINITLKNGFSKGFGGAIRNGWLDDSSWLIIKDSMLVGNKSDRGGGAIINGSRLIVSNSSFNENTAGHDGGAIVNSGELTISQSSFNDNTVVINGGAISNTGTLNIMHSTFKKNRGEDECSCGGAIFNMGRGNVSISEGTFTENSAMNYGGAIDNSGVLKIYKSVLTANIAKNGGACSNITGVFTISKATLVGNTTTGDGAVIANITGNFKTVDVEFNGNNVSKSVICHSGEHFIIEKCTFEDNLSSPDSHNIVNEGNMALISLEIMNGGKTVFNSGYLLVANHSQNILSQIYGEGSIKTEMISEGQGFDFGDFDGKIHQSLPDEFVEEDGKIRNFRYLDDLIHGGAKEVVLHSDIVLGDDEESEYLEGIILDVPDFVLDGNGHSIDARGKTRIFECGSNNLTLKNITFENGCHSSGCAIRAFSGKLEIVNSIFRTNRIFGGRIYDGVIYNSANLDISDSLFEENYAQDNSAIICHSYGNLTMEKVVFKQNHVQGDSVIIHNDHGNLTMEKVVFKQNMSTNSIIGNNRYFKLFKCIFEDNDAPTLILNNDFLESYGTIFNSNTSDCLISNGAKSKLGIFSNKFEDGNVAKSVIRNDGIYCHIENTSFNSISRDGGSRDIVNRSTMDLDNVKINVLGVFPDDDCGLEDIKNIKTILNEGHIKIKTASKGFENMIEGGGIVQFGEDILLEPKFDFGYLDRIIHECDSNTVVLQEDICFESYEKDFYEGGIELDIDGLVIDGNGKSIDGANESRIFTITGNNITLKNITFKNGRSYKNYDNEFNNGGGALRANISRNLVIDGCIFANNFSEEDAGAIHNKSHLTIHNCWFKDNSAMNKGGAIYNRSTKLNIAESYFDANESIEFGGGSIFNQGLLNIEKSYFKDNSSESGGVILNWHAVDIDGCEFVNNSSDTGGVIYNQGKINVADCRFHANNSKFGACIYTHSVICIENSIFEYNRSDSGGAIVYSSDENLTVTDCSFIWNYPEDLYKSKS